MSKKPKHSNKGFSRITSRKSLGGFTITELMIVLVVGGLILTIVFLAVPALQRNSRNSQYKNEAASILDATQQFVNNNRGAVPKCDLAYTTCFTSPPPFGLSSADLDNIKGLANLKNITWIVIPGSAGTAAPDLSPNLTTVVLQRGVKCGSRNANGDKYSVTTASSRSIVVVYALENANSTVNAQCMEME